MIPRETIDRVFSAARIEEVVGDYVSLKKRGANLIGLCPFHTEKTGSFTVSPSKGIYKCFGCGKAGNVVGFVMEIEQCNFSDAIKQVARKYHIPIEERELTPEEQQRQDDRESMFVVNEFANKWFQQQLWDTPDGQHIGLAYFRQRGLRDDTIRKFGLGFSPAKGNPLAAALKQQGFVESYILNNPDTGIGTGICGRSEDGRLYDRFRDRVIFPIHTVSGKTVAFAGRIMSNRKDVGKYVNSPDSIIYSKTNELYGIYLAKQAIARQDLCYLVEGQMDVISMHQAGIENVVASGGTALTRQQIRLIRRFTANITVLYDGDAAGIHAAIRGIDMFLEQGFNVKVLLLPDGEDPDSFARSRNASDFIEYIRAHQTDFIRFKAGLLSRDAAGDPQKFSELIRDLVQSISRIPDSITRQVYIKDTADQLHIQEQLLTREVARLRVNFIAEQKERETARNAAPSQAESPVTQTAPAAQSAPAAPVNDVAAAIRQSSAQTINDSLLNENFRNIIQLLVRYGERPVFQTSEGVIVSVGDYILSELQNDGIECPNALYQAVLNEYAAHCHDENFVAETFFKFHHDPAISGLAVELIADRYQLSRIYSRQSISENVTQEVKLPTDEDNLAQLVTQFLLELKYTTINQRIDALETALKAAQQQNDWEQMRLIMTEQPQLLNIKNQISQALGNRVITL